MRIIRRIVHPLSSCRSIGSFLPEQSPAGKIVCLIKLRLAVLIYIVLRSFRSFWYFQNWDSLIITKTPNEKIESALTDVVVGFVWLYAHAHTSGRLSSPLLTVTSNKMLSKQKITITVPWVFFNDIIVGDKNDKRCVGDNPNMLLHNYCQSVCLSLKMPAVHEPLP